MSISKSKNYGSSMVCFLYCRKGFNDEPKQPKSKGKDREERGGSYYKNQGLALFVPKKVSVLYEFNRRVENAINIAEQPN